MNESLADIGALVGGTVVGDPGVRISGVNGIVQAGPGQLTFLEHRQFVPYLQKTQAAAVLVTPDIAEAPVPLIQTRNPFLAFLKVMKECGYGAEPPRPAAGCHPSAVVDPTAEIGEGVIIDAFVRIQAGARIGAGSVLYAGAYVGHGTVVGENTILYPNVVIREGVTIGARCIIHSGAVIGGDGFGFVLLNGERVKVPQNGGVVIGDDVEIGVNTAIDRATFGDTVVGRGTKIDNLVQIGHNVQLGEACVICGMSGIAGSSKIGNRVTIAAQAGVADHMEVGDDATVAGRAGVATRIKPGVVVSGFPAIDHVTNMRILGSLRRLPEMIQRITEYEQRIKQLEELHGKAEDNSK